MTAAESAGAVTNPSADLFGLQGKTALVTGGRRGIGLAIVAALATFGADIVVASQNLDATGEEAERLVRAAGRTYTGHRVDFADRKAVRDFGAEMVALEPGIDILVNNAGTIRRSPAAEHSDEYWDEVLAVDLSAPFVLTREIGSRMLERGRGKVIFTASLLSFQGGINVVGYTAAKSGIAGITRAFSNEWASRGVTVNAIVPGYIATDNTQALQDDPARSAALLDRIPAGRWGTPADLAGAAVFLASRASDYVSGALLPVDGGWMGR